MKRRLISLLIFTSFISTLFAGWIIKEKKEDPDSGVEPQIETTYFQNNMIKTDDSRITIILNLGKETITIINKNSKSYWSGSFNEFIKENKRITEEIKKRMTEGMSPKEKEEFEKMIKPQKKSYSVKIEKSSEKEKIAGYEGVKYNVYVNGKLKEKIWISDKINVNKEVDLKKLRDFNTKLNKALNNEMEYDDTPEYEKLMYKGYDIKRLVISDSGIESSKEAIAIEKKNIPSSEFTVPSGYKKISLSELFGVKK